MSPIIAHAGEESRPDDTLRGDTLQDLIRSLHRIFDSENVNVEQVEKLMSSYTSKPLEWRHFAKFDQYRSGSGITNSLQTQFIIHGKSINASTHPIEPKSVSQPFCS